MPTTTADTAPSTTEAPTTTATPPRTAPPTTLAPEVSASDSGAGATTTTAVVRRTTTTARPTQLAPVVHDASLLACIRSWEQGAGGYATDTGNGFYGAYQFTLSTWRSVGGAGNPADASAAEQDARAWRLYLREGLSPWPTPAVRCAA